MRITTNLSFVLLALAAGAIAFPANPGPDPVKPEVTPSQAGVSSHTFSPPFLFISLPCPPSLIVAHLLLSATPKVGASVDGAPGWKA